MFLHDKSLIILRLQGTAKIIQRVHMIVNFSSVHKTGKRWVFIPIGKKDNAKECSNCHITTFISHASKVMLKILQVSLQQYVKRELPDVQTRFRKGRRTRVQIANICWIIRASMVSQMVKHLPAMQETQVGFLGWEEPVEKEMATHSSILAWK